MDSYSSLKDKVPPNDDEAERAALGAILLDWDSMQEIVTFLRPHHFYSPKNQTIYKAMLSLFQKANTRGDIISVSAELSASGELERAGGAAYVAQLTSAVPTSVNVKYYAQVVLDKAQRRELIRLSAEITASAFDMSKDAEAIIAEAERKIFALSQKNESTRIYEMKDVMLKTVDTIEKRMKSKGDFTGVPSGFASLDEMTSGFQNSELIVVGARPSIGKTALALSMMEYISVDRGIPCGFFSLEMSYLSIGQRMLSQCSKIPGSKMRSGFLQIKEFNRMQDAASKCYKAPLYIVDTPNMKLLDISALARRMVKKHQVKIIFIDYIGLITTENPTAPVYEQVSEVTKSLKALSRELEIPIVALCQVSREAEGGEPNLSQLRGSGSVEQDSDVVIFIHRDRKCDDPAQDARLIVAKQRNGSVGSVDIMFVPACTRFENKVREG